MKKEEQVKRRQVGKPGGRWVGSKVRLAGLFLLCLAARGEIIDGMAAVVGRRVITWSEVQREARLEAYFNGQPPPECGRGECPETLERLIQQRLLRHEMEQVSFPFADEAVAKRKLKELGPVTAQPADYGLKQEDLIEYARRLADADRFLELRFRSFDPRSKPASEARPEEVEEYYKKIFLPGLERKSAAQRPPLDQVRGQIEQILKEERELDDWLKDLRARLGVRLMEVEKP